MKVTPIKIEDHIDDLHSTDSFLLNLLAGGIGFPWVTLGLVVEWTNIFSLSIALLALLVKIGVDAMFACA